MASNKKAQILAAVMCASSIFGSYTVVSAADTPTKIESTDKNSSVTANGSTITATAGAQGSQQSTITLGNKSLAINVGKQTTTDGITYGAFTLNSSNLAVNNSGLSVKNTKGIVVGSISNTGAITGTGLTIKNGTGTTLASLNNNGLNIYDGINTKATATITKAGAITGTGLTVKAVSDTIKPEGDYVESKVTTSGVADTIKQGGFTRATSNVTTNSIKDTIYTDGGTELSSINVFKNTAANGIENGKVSLTAKKIVTDNQTSTTTTSTLTLGGDNASLKVGNYGFTVDSNNNVLFSGKNASLTSTGLTVNGTGTSSIKSTNTNENSSTVGSYTKNDISYNGMTTTAKGGKYPSDSDNDNKTTSSVTYTGVRDTVYDDSGNIKSTSVVDTNGVTLTSNRYDTGSKISSSLTIKGDSATLTSGTAYVKVDNTVGNVTLSGKNASLTSTGLTVNGTGISSIKSTNTNENSSTVGSYTKNDISYNGMTTTARGGKNPSESDNVNKTTSAVTYTGVTDTVYNVKGNQVASSSVTTNGIVNTTTNLSIDGSTNNTMSTSIYQDKRGISASATKKDEDGNTTGGISTTGAVTGTSLIITAENTAGNKTTSTVGATGVTDAVYGTDGARVAYSNVGTGGISNTTSLKTTTGKIDTAINQNTSGIGISSTKYDTNNKVTDKTSLTMNGSANNITSIKYNDSNKTAETTSVSVNGATSSITSYGNYVYGEDGKATSYNQASISLNGNTGTATIRGGSNTASSTLTLNEAGVALSGKNVGLNANGLTLYKDVDGVKTQYASLSTGGLSVNGTGSTTIKSTNATTGAIGQSQVSYNGVTDSFTKDDVTNSVTTNANGTTFSSTGNGSTTIKGDTIKTTNLIVNGKDIGGVATDVAGIDRNTENEDGLGYYTQIEGKTKIYNTGRFSTANGNFVVDPYGSITSKAGNYRFNMDRTNGFDLGYAATTSFTLDNTGVSLGFRNNSFILDKNGATFINANGENVSFTSINGGTITTGETVINGSSITTKDLYVDNIHLNGAITDGNGNVVGGGDLSLGADGTLDLKYNANGITNTFVSGATGVHSSFSNGTTTASSSVGYIDDKNTIGIKDQVGNTSVTTTTDGTTFANGSGSTTINGGNITTTGDVTVGGDLSVGDNFKVDGTTGNVTGGTYNGVQISTDKDGNAIIGGTNIGDLATNEEVNKVNDKVDAVDNKVGDTSKLDKEITDNQNYKDNPNLVGAVNAEADIRRNEISRIDGQIEQLDGRVGSLENRMSDVEDRIDKVGAMSAAIANLRTMGFDPEAPTEIAIGVGQYKSETGLALGVFHYPNQDFMLSASISTSGDEVMGGIGATWKLGRKSAAEKAKDEEARRLEKAEEMKKLAQDAKVKAQAERHAKLLAEREAQKTA
ncbi:YadA-like family protein [Megamonas funiformis]|uniref:YadA-like family protein n=1 Tax=Megamonas funiformis TaxID=437897 RepID=UPI00266F235A|nr:YadA-like family protein [Megamonas funiformis]